MNKKLTLSITLVLSILIALFTTGMAFASEGNEVEATGTVVGIYPEDFYLEIEVDNEGTLETLTVQVGQNFNFDTVVLGDIIEVKGTTNDEGNLVLTELKIQERARDRVQTQDGELESNYCAVEDQFHPIALKTADTYGIPYDVIEGYLCGETHVPLGQIMLALQTSALSDDLNYTDFLDGFENISWGKIWQELGLKGKPDHGTPPGQLKKQDSGKVPGEAGNGKGN